MKKSPTWDKGNVKFYLNITILVLYNLELAIKILVSRPCHCYFLFFLTVTAT